jgi:lantibiotic modifying enzyme
VGQEKLGRPVRFDLWSPSSLPTPSRLAWCYNDLGIAAVMGQISRLTLDSSHCAFAHDLLEHCIDVASKLSSPNAALCHGAAGVSHIMNRAYQETGDPRCLSVALTYLKRVLEMREIGRGVGGYTRDISQSADQGSREADPSFLSGAVGIALALLSAVTSIEPQWDRLLLLS